MEGGRAGVDSKRVKRTWLFDAKHMLSAAEGQIEEVRGGGRGVMAGGGGCTAQSQVTLVQKDMLNAAEGQIEEVRLRGGGGQGRGGQETC